MSADYAVDQGVAVITLNNPPVNGLGLATRSAAVAGLMRAAQDPAVTAIVITGGGKVFSGGADIREFNSPKALTEPTLHTLIATAERSPKPVVAAIHGVCMGGGLELALGCHYRVALAGARIGLPEVKLGLVPGAGGTQRLPRMVGLAQALRMITTGTPVLSEQLADTALFDRVFDGGADLLTQALSFARSIAATRPLPQVRTRSVDDPDQAGVLAAARAAVGASAGAFPAPLACVECIAASVNMAFEDGLAFERARFLTLAASPESKALRHAFFAERAASKVPDLASDTPTRTIAQVAVVGAGTMGAGIAMSCANAGLAVLLLDTAPEALARGLATIRSNYASSVKKGKLSEQQAEARIAAISATGSFAAIAQADLVIEAVFEDLAVKESVFRQLDAVMKPGAILATNTSTLDVNQIAAFTQRPQDVIGLHFFSPAHVMKLLEIVRGAATSKEVLASALALSKKLKKIGVVAGVCDGFIGNRMLEQYLRQAFCLLDEGVLPQQIDAAIEAFGFAMGPFRMSDLAGNDIGWAIRKRRALDAAQPGYSVLPDLLCEQGRFGQKTGAGWYDYPAGARSATPSAVVTAMIAQQAQASGVAQRQVSDAEIVERLVYALVNEGARILAEGIALRASDIDMVYLSGYGFPLHRGGPMLYADTVGLGQVLAKIDSFAHGLHGDAWTAAPLLQSLAQQGKGLNG